MAQILPETEVTEVEGRTYVNPQAALGESDTFIDNLRQTQQANTQQIAQDTYNLGTAVPSNLGGLIGGEGYWTSRYQTPQTNATVANLRAAAQAKALNDVLANEQAIWKNRYQQAYRNYQSRQNAKANQSTTQNPYADASGEDPEYETTTPQGTDEAGLRGLPGKYTVVDPTTGNLHIVDMYTGEEEIIYPGQESTTKQNASAAVGGGEIRTLPNGNTVLVKPGYNLTEENGQYYLVDSNGKKTAVGG